MDKLLEKLIPPLSVSGCEAEISKVLTELCAPYGETVSDHMGNLVLHKPGRGKRIMLAAHMDTIGLVATYIEENGFVRFGTIGGMRMLPAVGQRVRFENGVIGIICADRELDPKDLSADKLFIDTLGQPVQIGDTAGFCEAPYFCDGKVISPSLDNRLGCAICIKAMKLLQQTDNDIFLTFTVQEEVGRRGARPAAYTICPDLAIAVDICTVTDTPDAANANGMTLTGGPIVKYMDARSISHPMINSLLEQTAKELDIPVQRCVTKRGGTDASMILNSRGGVPAGTLAVPIRYAHTAHEVADLNTALQCAQLLAVAIAK